MTGGHGLMVYTTIDARDRGADGRAAEYPLPGGAAGHIVRPALLAQPARTARPEYMRELNLLIVLEAFRRQGAISRADVARETGISAPTVSKIVAQLLTAGLLMEEGPGVSTGGKRPSVLRFNGSVARVLGIDLGGTHLRLAVSDLNGAILARSEEAIEPAAGPVAIVDAIALAGRRLLEETGTTRLLAVALATPGVVDVERGVVVAARNLRGWREVPVRQLLTDRFGVPATVENDVNAAAEGERWRGAGRGHDTLVFVAIGTGIGAGVIIGGELHRGAHFAAGEINGLRAGTDDGAILEDVVSGPAIVRRARARGVCARDGGILTTEAVFSLARAGDPAAAEVVSEAVRATAGGVGALIAAIDPTVVVFGGGVSRQGAALIGAVRAEIGRSARPRAELVLSGLSVDAQLYGAVYAALRLADSALVGLVRGAGG